MALPGLVRANNLNDIVDQEKAWDNLGNNILAPNLPDIVYSNVSLLLHGNGTNGSTTITDNSPTPKTITAVGNAQISTAQSKFGGASIAFDGAGDYLTVPSGFPVGTENYTIEWWQKLAATNVIYNLLRLESPNTASGILVGGGRVQLYITGSVNTNYLRSFTFTTDWNHIVITRQSGSMSIFVDGNRLLTGSNQENQGASIPSTSFGIGRRWSSVITNDFSGYIDDFRITRGISRYTANFTPPDKEFYDLSNNSFIDFTLTITGRDILALNAVRNTSTRDFAFIKGLTSAAQPRITTAAQNAASGTVLRDAALLRNAPSSEGDYFVPRGVFDAGTLKINGIQAASVSSSPFSGSTALFPIGIRTMELSSNFRLATTFPSGTIASPERALPVETTSLVLYAKAGQS